MIHEVKLDTVEGSALPYWPWCTVCGPAAWPDRLPGALMVAEWHESVWRVQRAREGLINAP